MNTEHPIADEVLGLAQLALLKGECFMTYNNSLYFIDKKDVHFFNSIEEAKKFASDNISDYDRFNVIEFHSISDILRHIPYGQKLDNQLKNPDANGLYNKDGNAFTEALIEHFESKQLSSTSKTSSTITEAENCKNHNKNDLKPEKQKTEVKNRHQLLPKKANSNSKGRGLH